MKLLLTVLTAITISAGAYAELTLEQLLVIERYIQDKDTVGLFRYLKSNPALLQGDDPLAVELQLFVDSMEDDLIGNLSASSTLASGESSGADEPDGSGAAFGSFLQGVFAPPY